MRLKSLLLVSLFCIQGLFAVHADLRKYVEYLDQYPNTLGPIGSYLKGEIEIIKDQHKIVEIQQLTKRTVGIMAEDNYWIWLNDAVRFPNGTYGVYGRLIWRRALQGMNGVAILPLIPNGKIALNRNFRHATRTWEYELPRGSLLDNETPEQGALREMKEETGLVADKIEYLGKMYPDTGMTNTLMPVYLAQVTHKENAAPEDSEAIAGIDTFTIEELKEGMRKGYLIANIAGKSEKINLLDPFLAFALFQWEIRQ